MCSKQPRERKLQKSITYTMVARHQSKQVAFSYDKTPAICNVAEDTTLMLLFSCNLGVRGQNRTFVLARNALSEFCQPCILQGRSGSLLFSCNFFRLCLPPLSPQRTCFLVLHPSPGGERSNGVDEYRLFARRHDGWI